MAKKGEQKERGDFLYNEGEDAECSNESEVLEPPQTPSAIA